jgi:hypothetical protein
MLSSPEQSVADVLCEGLSTTLETWQDRFGGTDDLLFWTLSLKLAQTRGGADRVLRRVPGHLSPEVARIQRAINQYFDNIRYALLDPLTQVWGTLVNALRVAAQVDSVTPAQRQTFQFPVQSLVNFFRAAHQTMPVCEQLHHAFRPMPAPDCQMLAALLNVHVDFATGVDTLLRLVRLLATEGPLTAEESEAFGVLSHTGLIDAAFRGMRRAG